MFFTFSPPIPAIPADTAGIKTYLALGDSYTIGQSVTASERYPDQVAGLLKADGITCAPPEIIAQSGWTTRDLINRINTRPPLLAKYEFVSLLIGVNNQYQHLSQEQYEDEFTVLLDKAIKYAGNNKTRVFVLSIPDYGVTPFAKAYDRSLIAAEIDAFNGINKRITAAAGCNYLNITTLSRQALDDPSLTATDGLHPSGKQYKQWAALLAPLIKAWLH